MKIENNSITGTFCTKFHLVYFGPNFWINGDGNFISDIATCVVNCVFAIPAIVGNIIVISAILRTPSLRTPSNIVLCSVFSSDLLTGLIVQPGFVVMKIGELTARPIVHCVAMVISLGGAVMFSGNSFLSLTFLSVDKWLGLHYHLRYHEIVTIKRALLAIFVSWSVCFISVGVLLAGKKKMLQAIIILGCTSLFSVDIVVYRKVFKIVKHHENQIDVQLQATQQPTNSSGILDMRKHRKSTKAVFILYTLFLLCMGPIVILYIMYAIKGWNTVTGILTNVAATLCFINSSLNPAIFVFTIKEIRQAVKRVLSIN